MSKSGNPSIKAKTFGQNIFDIVGTNGVESGVVRTLGNDHNGFAFSYCSVLVGRCSMRL